MSLAVRDVPLGVSVVILSKNEELRIARCLDSVAWSDDVIVVDGYSTDRTVEIARSKGARVVQHAFTGSFADERNVGLDAARHEWVLTLDADDVVTADFVRKLGDALARREDVVVYKFRRKNFFLGHYMQYGGWCHYIPNLVRKDRVRYEGEVHEVPVYQGSLGTIDADVEHYPFDSLGQFVARQNRYTDIAARHLCAERPSMTDPEIRREMVQKTVKVFWKSYVKKQAYKDGFYGLIFSVLFAFINFLKWAKYWELTRHHASEG